MLYRQPSIVAPPVRGASHRFECPADFGCALGECGGLVNITSPAPECLNTGVTRAGSSVRWLFALCFAASSENGPGCGSEGAAGGGDGDRGGDR